MVCIVLVHHECSSGLLGPHPTTIHYTPPRFILKDPGLQLLGNPQKQVVVRDIIINQRSTSGSQETGDTSTRPIASDITGTAFLGGIRLENCVCYTSDYVASPTPRTHQPFNFNVQEKPPRLSFPYEFPTEFHTPPLHSRSSPIDLSPYLLRYEVRPLARPARGTSNLIFNNARSLLKHPLGPNSKTLSLCSCLFQTRSTPWMVCILTFQRHQ